MLQFDAETSALLDRAYRGRDFVRRRHANLAALNPQPGETVLDLGCGPGILLGELSGCVGPRGRAHGIDPSPDMLATAQEACAGLGNVTLREAGAEDLPFEDASLDGIVSVQVFEYLPDLDGAVAECARVLKPGGRLVIGDWHWDTLVWASDNPARMARMLASWDAHYADGAVPAKLPRLFEDAGLALRTTIPVAYVDTVRREDGIARMMQTLIASFVAGRGDVPAEEVDGWTRDLDRRAADGSYFFAFTHVVCVAERR